MKISFATLHDIYDLSRNNFTTLAAKEQGSSCITFILVKNRWYLPYLLGL